MDRKQFGEGLGKILDAAPQGLSSVIVASGS